MLDGAKISKVAVLWGTIIYAACALLAGILPNVYRTLAGYLVHFGMSVSAPEMTLISALIGLILWDIVVYLNVWLFVWLYNKLS